MSSDSRMSTFCRCRRSARLQWPRSKALRAERTARSTSGSPAALTAATTEPSRGLLVSNVSPLDAGPNSPSMKRPVRGRMRAAASIQSVILLSLARVRCSDRVVAHGVVVDLDPETGGVGHVHDALRVGAHRLHEEVPALDRKRTR